MAINYYFFNAVESGGVYDREYNAEDVTSYLKGLVGSGVFPDPSTSLQVSASTVMKVNVGAGMGWINGHKIENTATLQLTLDASDVLLDRIDDIIFYVDHTTREMGIEIKKGTLSATPVAPTLQRDSDRWEMCLAQISVAHQVTTITAAMITDTRANSSLCGIVQGLIQQIDTTTLWQQQQDAFDAWFASVQSQLQTALAVRRLEGTYQTLNSNEDTFDVTDYVATYSYVYDILDVYINGIHLNTSEYTLSGSVVTLAIPIVSPGAVVTFEVTQSYDPNA